MTKKLVMTMRHEDPGGPQKILSWSYDNNNPQQHSIVDDSNGWFIPAKRLECEKGGINTHQLMMILNGKNSETNKHELIVFQDNTLSSPYLDFDLLNTYT